MQAAEGRKKRKEERRREEERKKEEETYVTEEGLVGHELHRDDEPQP